MKGRPLEVLYENGQQEDIDMLLLLVCHGRHRYCEHIEADRAGISDIWQPSRRLLADYTKAHACCVKVHLYRAQNCDMGLAQVEMAQAGHR
jgi:hypothetical protein